jgi:hypothetical protein
LKPGASALLTAGFVAGCAAPSAPAGSIDPVDRKSVSRVEVSLRFHRVSVRSAGKIDALVDYFNARTGNWRAPGDSPPPAARASLVLLEPDGDHRVLGVGCDFFSTASSTRAHALREADSFRVRPMAAADLGELLQLVDERAFSALFSDCKR